MRLRNITGADTYIENSEYVVQDFKGQKGNWKELFHNENPIHIEVGMGKGNFILNNSFIKNSPVPKKSGRDELAVPPELRKKRHS